MSKDIRSFFKVVSKKPGDVPKTFQKTKKPPAIIDSDDEVIEDTPDKVRSAPKPKRRAGILESDSEDEGNSKQSKKQKTSPNEPKKDEKSKLKPINLDALNKPIKQSEVKHVPKEESSKKLNEKHAKPKKKTKKGKSTEVGVKGKSLFRNKYIESFQNVGVHGDKNFEKTLLELDEDSDDTILLDNLDILDKTIEEAMSTVDCNGTKANESKSSPSKHVNDKDTKKSEDNVKHKDTKDNKEKVKENAKDNEDTPKKATKRPRDHTESTPTPKKKQKLEQTDSGIDQDLEKFDRRRHSAELYVAYLHRGGPKHHGEKEYPSGKSDCLKGLTFLRTGVLDSLEGDEFENLVTRHGGRVVHGVSKKVNYVVVGEQPGPSKLEKAKKYNIPEVSEDEFLDIILVKSGMKPKYAVKSESEDFGIGGSENGSDKTDSQETVMEETKSPAKEREEHLKEREEKDSTRKPNLQKLNKKIKEEENGHSKPDKCGYEPIKQEPNSEKSVDAQSSKQVSDMKVKTEPCKKIKEKEDGHPKTDKSGDKPIKQEPKSEKSVDVQSSKQVLDVNLKKEPVETELKVEEKSGKVPLSESKAAVSAGNLSWTDKYKPTNIKSIIGQQDPNSNMNKLKRWLENWFKNLDPERRKKLPRPTPYNQYDGAYFKAALLSGPPGVGKTTTATLVAKELGFDIVEFNASDTRNKKLLHEEISHMMKSKTVAGFVSGQHNINQKRVLLMDEVDGMAGNEDRGGIAELINFIKTANFPIICMCNNRDLPKMRSLVNHCYALKFGKPNVAQVRGAMMSICFKEGLTIKPDALAQLIVGTGCDIRQTLNHLSMWSAAEKSLTAETVQKESKNSQKDVVFGAWDVIRKVFNKSENKDMSLADKSRLFFYDYSFGPMFVQENYLTTEPECTGPRENKAMETLIRRHLASDCLSNSDLIESKIRGTNNWSLLESQAFMCTVLPSHYLSGKMDQVRFPGWFGKNSQRNKSLRMISELYSHARTSVSGDKFSIRLDYAEPLMKRLLTPLTEKQAAGIDDTLEIMKTYCLLRDDLSNLCELMTSFDNRNRNPFDKVSSSVKSALTRKYNKTMVLSFAPPTASKKKKGAAAGQDELLGEEEEEEFSEGEDNEDNIDTDALIKVKNKNSGKATTSKSSEDSKSKGKSSKSGESSKKSKGKAKK